jgi:hypothetical protein
VLDPIQQFDEVVNAFADDPAVTRSDRRGFARGGLMRDGKLFATLRGDALLLKLPSPRVAELIATGAGLPFDANKGQPMKEWITVRAAPGVDWLALSREAARFAGG